MKKAYVITLYYYLEGRKRAKVITDAFDNWTSASEWIKKYDNIANESNINHRFEISIL